MIKVESLKMVAYCIDGIDQYEFSIKKVTKYKSDPYNRYKCQLNNSSPSKNISISSDYHYIDCSDNDFCEFRDLVENFAIKFIYVTFGSILILFFAITLVKCCARDKRRRAKRNLERIEAEESLAWSTAKAKAATSPANQIVQNVTINVSENNQILNNVNVNDFDQAQPEPAPRSIFNRNYVINNRESRKKNNYDEFELDEIELEPQVDY